ncbi:hypothetical protein F0365_12555 [Nonlabens sp. Ci31]|jgi:hypothetical protein|uniref:hypothetical protein n=1 Tax=Nonlabens sp. Ci31 TaxID=2608253 RepID=UPI0014637363|nr:hypothetical protein [Nonlabens sp. Ci31]QJP35160.1 hypothetical protein F0365_12555 [Nonlabens sp. Ci31]
MKKIFLLLLTLIFCSCNSGYDYKISDLESQKLKFDKLPQIVKEFFLSPQEFEKDKGGYIDLACLDQKCYYKLEVVKTSVGSWVSYVKLIDEKTGLSYYIDQGIPQPYIIHSEKLYLINQFNVFTTVEDFSTLEITCYNLKS